MKVFFVTWIVGCLLIVSGDAAASLLPIAPETLTVQSLDRLVLEYQARHCETPEPDDVVYVGPGTGIELPVDSARDPWGQPFSSTTAHRQYKPPFR